MACFVAMQFIDYFYRCVCQKTQFIACIFVDGSCGQSKRPNYLKSDLGERAGTLICCFALAVAAFVETTILKCKFVTMFVNTDKSVMPVKISWFLC